MRSSVFVPKKILLCSATVQEIKPFLKWAKQHFEVKKQEKNYWLFKTKKQEWHILITGVGMTNTAYFLGKKYASCFDWALNVGIAGAFDSSLNIGECVVVVKEIFSELGAEDGTRFLPLSALGLGNEVVFPQKLHIPNFFSSLKKVNGITVNKVLGHTKSIEWVRRMFHPQTETMEGAAFYLACQQNKWRCLELRAISNYVKRRNKSEWNVSLAITNLNHLLIQYIQSI